MNWAVRALCLLVGLALVCGVVADERVEPAPPGVAAPAPPDADERATPETPATAGQSVEPAPAPVDAAASAKRPEKAADVPSGAQRDSLWLLLLQVLRSPK